jgi:hypothetical protein
MQSQPIEAVYKVLGQRIVAARKKNGMFSSKGLAYFSFGS